MLPSSRHVGWPGRRRRCHLLPGFRALLHLRWRAAACGFFPPTRAALHSWIGGSGTCVCGRVAAQRSRSHSPPTLSLLQRPWQCAGHSEAAAPAETAVRKVDGNRGRGGQGGGLTLLLTSWFLWASAPCSPSIAVPSGNTLSVICVAAAQTDVRVQVPAAPPDASSKSEVIASTRTVGPPAAPRPPPPVKARSGASAEQELRGVRGGGTGDDDGGRTKTETSTAREHHSRNSMEDVPVRGGREGRRRGREAAPCRGEAGGGLGNGEGGGGRGSGCRPV